MRIQHNIMAMSAYRNYTNNVSAMKKNLEKLSSGYKINRAGDDAAGLAISEKMRAQITGLETAQKNAKDGISLVQTAEGALTEVHDMLNRMVELATQSANGTYANTTDRNQMQKEVDQLLSEINRIADSSNFNGIKLLDGSLGLNQDAFKIAAGSAFQAAVGINTLDVSEVLTGSTATAAGYHGGESITGQPPKFSIDLKDIEIKYTGTATSGTVEFTITGPGSFSLDVSVASVTASGVKASGLASAIIDAIASKGTAAGTTGTFNIGGLYMKASYANGKINFTFFSTASDATAAETWENVVSGSAGASIAKTFNDAVFGSSAGGVTVAIASSATGTVNGKGNYFCNITAVQDAVADQPADRPGIDIDLTKVVKDGHTLTIDGKTYTFKTKGSDSVVASTASNIIDVSMVASADQAHQAALIMAGSAAATSGNLAGNAGGVSKTAGDFTISMKGGNVIHIDITNASKASKADDFDKMKKLIVAKDAGTPAQAATTKLTVTASKINEGDSISVTNGSVTTKYVFGSGTNVTNGNNLVTYLGTDKAKWTAAALASAIGPTAEASGSVITIKAKSATASAAAPRVLGRGLTLQIGDTADSFNQLNVAVQNMHTADLGIGNLSIANEVDAQKAIDKIKNAINTVSDVRGTLGATQNRLDHTINNLSVMTENIQDAESTIRDVDVAEEMMAYTKNNILIQSAQAMLAQANQVPQGVLQLLG